MTTPVRLSQVGLEEAEVEALCRVLRSGQLASGPCVTEFEAKFARYSGASHGIAVANGTAGLHAALLSAGVSPGEKVLTSPFSFVATANAIRNCGAIPVFADVQEGSFNLEPDSIESALQTDPSIRAVLVVHLFGRSCDLTGLKRLRQKFGFKLVEDCAQAHGARDCDGTPVGTLGDAGVFSFYATKNMTTGEGGMIVCQDASRAALCRQLINHGRVSRYEHAMLGFNYRLTEFQGALGLEQLTRLPELNHRRRQIAARYDTALGGISWLRTPQPALGHVYHLYTLVTDFRDRLQAHLEKDQIESGVIYPRTICDQPCYSGFCEHRADQCGTARRLASRVLSIPVHPHLKDAEVDRVIASILSFQP